MYNAGVMLTSSRGQRAFIYVYIYIYVHFILYYGTSVAEYSRYKANLYVICIMRVYVQPMTRASSDE